MSELVYEAKTVVVDRRVVLDLADIEAAREMFPQEKGNVLIVAGGTDYVIRSIEKNPAPVAVATLSTWNNFRKELPWVYFAALPHNSTDFYAIDAVAKHQDKNSPVDFGEFFNIDNVATKKSGSKKYTKVKKKDYKSSVTLGGIDEDEFDAAIAYWVAVGEVGEPRKCGNPIPQSMKVNDPDSKDSERIAFLKRNQNEGTEIWNMLRSDPRCGAIEPFAEMGERFETWATEKLYEKATIQDSRNYDLLCSKGKSDTCVWSFAGNVKRMKLNGKPFSDVVLRAAATTNWRLLDGEVIDRDWWWESKDGSHKEYKPRMKKAPALELIGGNGYNIRGNAVSASLEHDRMPTVRKALGGDRKAALKHIKRQFIALIELMQEWDDLGRPAKYSAASDQTELDVF